MVVTDKMRKKYTVDNIKLLTYSMTDSVYDILFNTAHALAINSRLKTDMTKMVTHDSYMNDECAYAIHRQMMRDLIVAFPDKISDSDFHSFVIEFIKTYYKLANRAIRRYTGSYYNGLMYPDDIATNGCKSAYLFVHERHPKHKLNSAAKYEVETIVNDFFGNEKNLGEI